MAPKKSKPLASSVSNSRLVNDEDCVEVIPGKSTQPLDHWAFLDEIEAPMWVDLTSEAKNSSHENDDGWFQISHPFHQCSSRELISAFSHSGEVCINSIFGAEGPSSPELPSSVSRSRGKDYKSKKWAQTTKQHPVKKLSSKPSRVNSGYVKQIKPGSGNERPKTQAGSQAGSGCKSSLSETAGRSYSRTNPSFGRSMSNSDATVLNEGEGSSISTITSESNVQNQQKSLEVSRQINGHTSGLLSSLRISLRKSCVTRPASRVEKSRVRKSEGSSSSKSSVGSSSYPGGYDGRNKTPDSRNIMRIIQVPENKVKGPSVSKAPTAQFQNILSNSRWRIETVSRKFVNQETSKAKVQHRFLHSKVLAPLRINEQDRSIAARAKDKARVDNACNRLPGADKENALKITTMSQNSMTRGKVSEATVQVQKAAKGSMTVKNIGGKQVGPKANITRRSEAKKSSNMVQYMR